MVKVRENLTGQQFGRLRVLYQTEDYISPKGKHYAQYHCVCNCDKHTEVNVVANQLTTGHTQSCGCLHSEQLSQRNTKVSKKYNKFDISTFDYGIGYTNKNEKFYFDLEDYELIKDVCWSIILDYVRGYYNQERIKMHRLIMNCFDDGLVVHHINGNKVDNRRNNLIILTHNQHSILHGEMQKQNKLFDRKEIENFLKEYENGDGILY